MTEVTEMGLTAHHHQPPVDSPDAENPVIAIDDPSRELGRFPDVHGDPFGQAELVPHHLHHLAGLAREPGQGGAQVGGRSLLRVVAPEGASDIRALDRVLMECKECDEPLRSQRHVDVSLIEPERKAIEEG